MRLLSINHEMEVRNKYMKAKLIVIEGLPGSGKSTISEMVYEYLRQRGINAEFYSESSYDHPVDFDGVAYFSNEKFMVLEQKHLSHKELLNKIKVNFHQRYLIPYRKVIEEQKISFQDSLFKDITKSDVYQLPIELHKTIMIKRWNDFVNNHINEDKVFIFECCLIQNPVTFTMVKNNCHKEVTTDYIKTLAKIIAPLNPVLLYIDQQDIKKSFKKAVAERPEEWFQGFMYYYTNQGFGLDNNLKGFDGVLQVLEERSKLEKDIYDSLELTKYKVDNSDFNYYGMKEKIKCIVDENLR
ncbi:hypothetical protein Clocel_2987 [Clostridium cellulovorans 743B]|uniref:Uncharacterized protein n=2 Tax=Clostridium cellulovorans TaxID=1493 RepID=D9ST17_CLOC7|nr:hypothetical protein Clocel_2987 [Clostridium cellulovorans 743B]